MSKDYWIDGLKLLGLMLVALILGIVLWFIIFFFKCVVWWYGLLTGNFKLFYSPISAKRRKFKGK